MEINYEAQIEAILFTMGESVEITKIAKALELKPGEVKEDCKINAGENERQFKRNKNHRIRRCVPNVY